jgi:hypothetical protein
VYRLTVNERKFTKLRNKALGKKLVLTSFYMSDIFCGKRGPKPTKSKIQITIDADIIKPLKKHITKIGTTRSSLINKLLIGYLDAIAQAEKNK